MAPRSSLPAAVLAGLSCLFAHAACSRVGDVHQPEENSAQMLHRELELDPLQALVAPPSDGPPLIPLEMSTPVYARPDRESEQIGYLRVGARVPRSEEPVSLKGCPEGWYHVRPLGFVCTEKEATVDEEHPVARAIQIEPDRSKPMPYAYGFLRAVAPNYLRVPSKELQVQREMRLERHLRNWRKLSDDWDALEVGANDVPLGPEGAAIGEIPKSARPMDMSERYGGLGVGHDERPWWLADDKRLIPNLSSFKAPSYADIAGRSKRHAGLSLIGSFVAKDGAFERRFAITTDARLVPADKIKADSGSPFHGEPLGELGLPVAFASTAGASFWTYEAGKLERSERLGFRQFVPLSGRVQRIGGVRMVQARDGRWLRSDDLKTAVKPTTLPWFASRQRRWIQVSLLSQTLVLWEGATPVYATLVSTGRDGIGDPKTTMSTPQGTFRVYQKHVTTTMDSNVADSEFELRDVPWVMYFQGGYALHAAYWHDDFGRPRSHGCINMAPIDARYVFNWSGPDVPLHWHGVNAGETFDQGTIVHIVP